MDNKPRFIFYLSGVFLLSVAITLFTSEFLSKVNDPSFTGMLFLLGFGLIYMNLIFATSRRFMRRLDGASISPYILGAAVALPPVIWVNVYEAGLGSMFWLYIATIIIACGAGAFFGHRSGLKAQIVFQKNLQEYLNQDEKVPEDLKRPHDKINKN